MSVAKMCSVSIIGDKQCLARASDALGETGVFQPDEVKKFYSSTSAFTPLREDNIYAQLLGELRAVLPEEKADEKKDADEFTEEEIREYIARLSEKTQSLKKRREQISAELEQCEKSSNTMKRFTRLQTDLKRLSECRRVLVRYGVLPRDAYDKYTEYYANDSKTVFFPVQLEGDRCYGMYFAALAYAEEAERIFSGLYFEPVSLSDTEGTPEQILRRLQSKLDEGGAQIEQIDRELEKMRGEERERVSSIYGFLHKKDACFAARKYAVLHGGQFIICGWCPENEADRIKASLGGMESVEVKIEKAKGGDRSSPPVKLKNGLFSKPYEFYVGMYGLPSYGENDPTPFVALTYTVLFGIMFGDLGQGIAVALIGLFLWRIKHMPLGRILIPCGISASLFGLVYGSVFGYEHALDPLYRMLGFDTKPVDVMKPETTQLIIYLSVAAGFLLVTASIILNIFSSLRQKRVGHALFGANGAAGLVLYVSLAVGLAAQLVLKIRLLTPLYIVCLVVIPLLLIFFSEVLSCLVEKKTQNLPKNVAEYLMQSFFELFEVMLGYVTNTMSYLRVGAFVLVHAGMMAVVFTLAQMADGVGYVITVIVGNVIVMCLEALLVSIQVLRLEFYEMFSRFYTGEGEPYEPVKITDK